MRSQGRGATNTRPAFPVVDNWGWAFCSLAIFPDLAAMVILSNEFKRQLLATVEEDPEITLAALGERIAKVFAFQVRSRPDRSRQLS